MARCGSVWDRCPPPTSLPDTPVAPYYVPFSALTVRGFTSGACDLETTAATSKYNNAEGLLAFHHRRFALQVGAVGNLLVSGKTMAQSFAANAATRLHPVEWATGAAAGVAAALMAVGSGQEGAQPSTSDVLASQDLLDALRSAIGERHAPLDWEACPAHG